MWILNMKTRKKISLLIQERIGQNLIAKLMMTNKVKLRTRWLRHQPQKLQAQLIAILRDRQLKLQKKTMSQNTHKGMASHPFCLKAVSYTHLRAHETDSY